MFYFAASVIGRELKHADPELLDARRFSFEEFGNMGDDEIRKPEMRTKTIVNDITNS